ncbi:hypothetical protein [Streptomyces sp. 184]|uniref:hypothetical protein n=1 Tax=Streptomyces sp. 184 TaxID=1827526 RepID=UPI00389237EC
MTGARERDWAVDPPAGGPGARERENTGSAARSDAGAGTTAGPDTPEERRAADERRAAAEGLPRAGEPARTETPGILTPAAPTPGDPAAPAAPTKDGLSKGGPATTDPGASAEPVAAHPVAVADPVTPAPGTPASAAPAAAPPLSLTEDDGAADRPLMAPSERDDLDDRLHRATGRFVDDPPGAVDDACVVLDDLGARIAALLAERRDAYRDLTRNARTAEGTANAETERLRLALRDSRDLAERLLKL